MGLLALAACLSAGCLRLSFVYTVSSSGETQLRASLELPPEEISQTEFGELASVLSHNFPNTLAALKNMLAEHENAAELLAYLEQVTHEVGDPTQIEDGWTHLSAVVGSPGIAPVELQGLELDMLTSVLEPPWDSFSQVGDLMKLEQTDAGWQFKVDVGAQGNALLANFGLLESSLRDTDQQLGQDHLTDLAITYTVTLPGSLETTTGKVTDTGAGSTTVSWQLFPVVAGEPYLQQGMILETALQGTTPTTAPPDTTPATSTGSNGFPLWLALVLAGVGVLLVLTLLPARYRRRWLTGDFSGSKLKTGVFEEGEEISMADPASQTAREPD